MATAPTATPVQSWINKGANDIPMWIKPRMVSTKRDPNGTFLIHSRAGSQRVQCRVNVGDMVIARKGVLYARHPSEARALVQELDDQDNGIYAALPKKGEGGNRVADVAPRDDDTDDISRRIQAQQGKATPPAQPVKIASEPQKTAAKPPPVEVNPEPRKWLAAKGNPPSVENRHPSELRLDDSYQRSTDNGASQALIKRIATGWDWRMCLPLVVSKRDDGSLWVIDGQHRLAAAILRGDIQFLPCCVGVYGSVADEAAMFVAMNRARKPMNRLDDFHAAIASGDEEAITIATLITDAGLSVSRKTGSQSWQPGDVAFTGAISRMLRKHGAEVCAGALMAIRDTWPDQVLNAGSSMFLALSKLTVSPPDGFDHARLMRALSRRSQREWASFLNEVKGGGDERALQLRKVLLMAYEEEADATNPETL